MSGVRIVLLAGAALLTLTPAASAQLAAGGKLGWVTLQGDGFEGADNGIGLEGFIRYQRPTGLGIEGGVHFASHDVHDESVDVVIVFVEPRLTFPLRVVPVRPFVGARASWVRLETVEPDGDATASGFGFGGVGGVAYSLAPPIALEAALWYSTLSLGDLEANGASLPNSDRSGGMLAVRVGLTVLLNR